MDIYGHINLEPSVIKYVTCTAKDWALSHGIVMKNQQNESVANHAPFTLFPTPFPPYLYSEAMDIQKDFQLLFYRASQDFEFIKESLKSVVIHDEFTKQMMDIYEQVMSEGITPKAHFTITRSDYMIDQVKKDFDKNIPMVESRPYEIKQIEMNMIAASFSGLISNVVSLHRYIADELEGDCPFDKNKLASQVPIKNLGYGMAQAFQAYGNENAIIIFITDKEEYNTYDQRQLEYSFHEGTKAIGINKHVRCLFRSLQQIHDYGELQGDKLFMDGDEVALCYFRAGYSPSSYCNQDTLDARLMIERSCCIKCPTIGEQLVGTKKIQQVMAKPGMVEKFIKDENAVKRIRRTFAGLFSLDPGHDGDEAAKKALDEPSRYVLKPQREGGGNNMYDGELVKELKRVEHDSLVRSQYILMERILPPVVKNYIVHYNNDMPSAADTVTELGVFGYLISEDGKELVNETAGHLLRTKSIEHKDGGVASGRAVLDTPYLL